MKARTRINKDGVRQKLVGDYWVNLKFDQDDQNSLDLIAFERTKKNRSETSSQKDLRNKISHLKINTLLAFPKDVQTSLVLELYKTTLTNYGKIKSAGWKNCKSRLESFAKTVRSIPSDQPSNLSVEKQTEAFNSLSIFSPYLSENSKKLIASCKPKMNESKEEVGEEKSSSCLVM